MKKFAFEVSDNPAIYAHMLPLLKACIDDDDIIVSLYSSDAENFLKLESEYHFFFNEKLVPFAQIVLDDTRLYKIKKMVVNNAQKLKITKILPLLRFFFTCLRKDKRKQLDDSSSFYQKNASFFEQQDVLLTTELKGRGSFNGNAKLVWLLHGVSANDNAFYKSWTCDLVVCPLIGFKDQLVEKSDFPFQSKIYTNAYLKYDLIKLSKMKSKIFDTHKYTVVYNPHWDSGSGQSSWFDLGFQILEFFYNQNDINLIFAPHINLSRYYDIQIPQKYYNCPNIHIDLNSNDLLRGTYIAHADCYLGDVSSQYFEYILCKPDIDAIFFNSTGFDWRDNPAYLYWEDGEVINEVASLASALNDVRKNKKNRCQRFHDIPDNQVYNLLHYIKFTILE